MRVCQSVLSFFLYDASWIFYILYFILNVTANTEVNKEKKEWKNKLSKAIIHNDYTSGGKETKSKETTQKKYRRYDLCAWNFSVSVHGNLNKQTAKE